MSKPGIEGTWARGFVSMSANHYTVKGTNQTKHNFKSKHTVLGEM